MRTTTLLLLLLLTACNRRCVEPSRSVLGKVIDASAQPVRGAVVRLSLDKQTGHEPMSGETDESGWFVFHGVPKGAGRVQVRAAGFLPALGPVRSGMVLISMKRTSEIEGSVLLGDAPLEGAIVEVVRGNITETGWSDATGHFVVGGLTDGEFVLTLTLPPQTRGPEGAYVVAPREFTRTVRTGEEAVSLVIPAGAQAKIKTNFPSVSIEGEGILSRRYDVGADGMLNLSGFPPGRTTFLFHNPDGTFQTMEEVLHEGQVLPIEMQLPLPVFPPEEEK